MWTHSRQAENLKDCQFTFHFFDKGWKWETHHIFIQQNVISAAWSLPTVLKSKQPAHVSSQWSLFSLFYFDSSTAHSCLRREFFKNPSNWVEMCFYGGMNLNWFSGILLPARLESWKMFLKYLCRDLRTVIYNFS